jgi:hypothetical protein
MAHESAGQRIAFLPAPREWSRSSSPHPWQAVTDAGSTSELLSPEPGMAQSFHHLDKGDTSVPVNRAADAIAAGALRADSAYPWLVSWSCWWWTPGDVMTTPASQRWQPVLLAAAVEPPLAAVSL